MSENTIKLLSEHQRGYLKKVLKNREYFKKLGKKYVTVEKSIFSDEYKVYLQDYLEGKLFDNDIVEYIEL